MTSNKPICWRRAAFVGFQILFVGLAFLPLAGCGGSSQGGGAAEDLTPTQFEALPDHRKAEYRQIELRIPEGLNGVQLLPVNRGRFDSVVDRAVHTGMLEALMAQYTRALFESEFPQFKVEFVPFEMWGEDFKAVLAASLASGKAPAAYVARDLPGTAEQGLFADITDLIKGWDQADLQPATAVAWGYIRPGVHGDHVSQGLVPGGRDLQRVRGARAAHKLDVGGLQAHRQAAHEAGG